MYFDTHCHLNFKVFDGRVEEVIKAAKTVGVNYIVVPGTDVETSKKAVKIAEKHGGYSPERSRGIYAAVGIHPHHVYQYQISKINPPAGGQKYISNIKNDLEEIEKLLRNNKVVAIGEVGVDRHYYQKTKHQNYKVNEEFIELQKELFVEQIKLAIKYRKALIIHNREAKKEVLKILTDYRLLITDYRAVFHCCEPDERLLEFAIKNHIFIGVDGDVTYCKEKQQFIETVPLDMLVLETDSPYLSPFKKFPNEPKNLKVVAEFISQIKNVSINQLIDTTTENAKRLFKVSPYKD